MRTKVKVYLFGKFVFFLITCVCVGADDHNKRCRDIILQNENLTRSLATCKKRGETLFSANAALQKQVVSLLPLSDSEGDDELSRDNLLASQLRLFEALEASERDLRNLRIEAAKLAAFARAFLSKIELADHKQRSAFESRLRRLENLLDNASSGNSSERIKYAKGNADSEGNTDSDQEHRRIYVAHVMEDLDLVFFHKKLEIGVGVDIMKGSRKIARAVVLDHRNGFSMARVVWRQTGENPSPNGDWARLSLEK